MRGAKRIRIVFADDHGIVRDGLRTLFRSDPGFRVVGEASDGAEVVRLTEKLKPDVAILDISMPGMNGIEATRIIREKVPGTKILILTIHESEEFVYEMIHAGASGYLLKNAEKKEILSAVRTVGGGESFFSPSVSRLLIDGVLRQTKEHASKVPGDEPALTRRETEILRHIAEGSTSREIAATLHISFSTVNTHRTNLMKKLDIHDTAGLVRFAIRHNILSVQP